MAATTLSTHILTAELKASLKKRGRGGGEESHLQHYSVTREESLFLGLFFAALPLPLRSQGMVMCFDLSPRKTE